MKKKKMILIIILFIITIALGVLLILKFNNIKEEIVVKQSNDRNDTVAQLIIVNDEINIREEANVDSLKLGVVKKDEIYTILDTTSDEYYTWYLIETSNNIKGYIAGNYDNEDYVSLLDVVDSKKEVSE